MDDIIRVGIVSTVDLKKGMAQVYYPDRGSTTAGLHLFAFRSEYSPPSVGDQVLVAHLSNDTSTGIVLGRFWGEADLPPQEPYRKDMGKNIYEAVKDGGYTVHSPEIRFEGDAGSITLSELINLRSRIEALERGNA